MCTSIECTWLQCIVYLATVYCVPGCIFKSILLFMLQQIISGGSYDILEEDMPDGQIKRSSSATSYHVYMCSDIQMSFIIFTLLKRICRCSLSWFLLWYSITSIIWLDANMQSSKHSNGSILMYIFILELAICLIVGFCRILIRMWEFSFQDWIKLKRGNKNVHDLWW